MQDEIMISLSKSIESHYKGGIEYCNELVISAPTSKVQKLHLKLESAFVKAISNQTANDNTESNDTSESKEIKAAQIVMLLMMSDIEIDWVFDTFKALILSKGMAFLAKNENKVDITAPLYDSLALNDVKKALGEYIKVFIWTSIQEELKA